MLYLDSKGKLHLGYGGCENIHQISQRIMIDLDLAFVLSNRCHHCGTAEDFENEVKGKLCPKCDARMDGPDINGIYECLNCGHIVLRER